MKPAHSFLQTRAAALFLVAMTIALPARAQNSVLTTLYTFTGQNNGGANPHAGGALLSDGSFYGTTSTGGTGTYDGRIGSGTVFKVSSSGEFTVLHNFLYALTSNPEGADPETTLIKAADGSLYGTTYTYGIAGSYNGIFRITSSGAFTIVYECASNEANIKGALFQTADGSFYGCASQRGTNR